jgi:hypothetical protein
VAPLSPAGVNAYILNWEEARMSPSSVLPSKHLKVNGQYHKARRWEYSVSETLLEHIRYVTLPADRVSGWVTQLHIS